MRLNDRKTKIFSNTHHNFFDLETIALGTSGAILMENAGVAAFNLILNKHFKNSPNTLHKTFILCGKGGNGGDGLVVARKMLEIGLSPKIYILADKNEIKGDSLLMLSKLEKLKPKISFFDQELPHISDNCLIIDAIFGTGFKGNLNPNMRQFFADINKLNQSKIISLDCPSGVNADTLTQSSSDYLKADHTITFGFKKPYHVSQHGISVCGLVDSVDIGYPESITEQVTPIALELNPCLPPKMNPRPTNAFKNKFGHTLVIGGSEGMYGAPILAASAALKSGSGLVTLILPKTDQTSLPTYYPEIMLHQTSNKNYFSEEDVELCQEVIREKNITSLVIGMGLGQRSETKLFIDKLLETVVLPTVIDADGLIALKSANFPAENSTIAITPHPGEYKKYISTREPTTFSDLQSKAEEKKCHIIFKSTAPIICSPNKTPKVLVNPISALAKAGSGDILAGIIGGLAGQSHISFHEALELGVQIHNRAGHICAKTVGHYATSASNIVEEISNAVSKFLKS